MLEPPDLSNEVIVAAVQAHYGIAVADATFLPIGHDPSAWVYRLRVVSGRAYFLKVRAGIVNGAGLGVPRHLHDCGVADVVAPLPTMARALWVAVDGFALILYPFVDGVTGMDGGMTERQWVSYGAVLGQVHATALTPELDRQIRRESYVPAGSDMLKRLDRHIAAQTFADPIELELAGFWRERRAEIRMLVERAEALGRRLRAAALPLVLCHADIRTANVLIDRSDRLWIVDWDETALAPRERDLMFVVGGITTELVGAREEAWFFRGYGPIEVDPLALAYDRYAWAVGDVGAYGEQALLLPGVGATSRRAAVDGPTSLFQPGRIVALAYAADGLGL